MRNCRSPWWIFLPQTNSFRDIKMNVARLPGSKPSLPSSCSIPQMWRFAPLCAGLKSWTSVQPHDSGASSAFLSRIICLCRSNSLCIRAFTRLWRWEATYSVACVLKIVQFPVQQLIFWSNIRDIFLCTSSNKCIRHFNVYGRLHAVRVTYMFFFIISLAKI